METGRKYTLSLTDSQDELYASNETEVYHQGSINTVFLPVRKKQPGVQSVKSQLSDSDNYGNVIIKDISIPAQKFVISGTWDNLTPGYYEVKSTKGSISLVSDKPVFEFHPETEMQVGEELWVRMVSKAGVASPWFDAKLMVLPIPSLGFGPKLNIIYKNGGYVIDSMLKLSQLTGDKLSIRDKVPLLDGGAFGLGSSNNRFEGWMYNGTIYIEAAYSGGHGMSTKKSKMVTTGYNVEADLYFFGQLYSSKVQKSWALSYYWINFMGRGEYFWKKSYNIPKLDIGGWGKLTMGSNIGGLLEAYGYSGDRDFKGVLTFRPYVSIEVGGGIEKTLSVEGSVTGSVPGEYHIPTGYVEVEPDIVARVDAYYIFDSENLYKRTIAKEHWDNGKKKINLFMLGLEEEEIELTPMPTSYLERGSNWLAGNSMKQRSMSASSGMMAMSLTGSNPRIEPMADNIYPRAEVQLVSGNNKQWLVWTEHNPVRDQYNRTQLKVSVFDGGSWSAPEWFGNQITADFAPTAAAVENGMLLAWQNVKNPMTEENRKEEYVRDSEINVTRSVFSGEGEEPDIITLTNDEKYDHLPVLAAADGNAMLVWTKSEGLSVTFGSEMEKLRAPAGYWKHKEGYRGIR